MPTGKRASMREGPLAALFRKTAEDAGASPEAAGSSPRPSPRAASRAKASGEGILPCRRALRLLRPSGRAGRTDEAVAEGEDPGSPPRSLRCTAPRRPSLAATGRGAPDPLAAGASAPRLLGRHPREPDGPPGAAAAPAPAPDARRLRAARTRRPRRTARPSRSARRSCASSASAAPASTRSTGWSRPRSKASSSWRSTPTCSRCSSRRPTRRSTSAMRSRAVSAPGSNPELGRQAAREEYDRIKALLRGSDMVFIAAGAGGGTGTGAGPIVAQIARELGALTVGIVTKPFQFEGSRRRDQAEAGIEALADEVDTLIVVPNNRLLSVLDRNTSMVEAFRVADDVLRQGVQGISDLVTLPGLINLDFADVRTIMSDAGNALLGIGMGTGERRADRRSREGRVVAAARDEHGGRSLDPAVDHRRARHIAVGGQRGGQGRRRGGPSRRQHHLRRDGRREARRPGVGDRGRDRLRERPRPGDQRRPAARPAPRAAPSPAGRGSGGSLDRASPRCGSRAGSLG